MATGALTAQEGLRVSVGEKVDPNRRTNSGQNYLLSGSELRRHQGDILLILKAPNRI
jgi:hypothetical protein